MHHQGNHGKMIGSNIKFYGRKYDDNDNLACSNWSIEWDLSLTYEGKWTT